MNRTIAPGIAIERDMFGQADKYGNGDDECMLFGSCVQYVANMEVRINHDLYLFRAMATYNAPRMADVQSNVIDMEITLVIFITGYI